MKTVIITGAARGIGRATALKFAKEGYKVVLNAQHPSSALQETTEECTALSGQTSLSVAGDISDPAFVNEFIRTAASHLGTIDVLINNAGISFVGLIQDTDDDTWQKVINTNLSAVHYCTRAVIPYMLKNKSGSIVNVSSVWGNAGASCEVAYSASKGGVNAYTKAAAKELAPSGISVNAVACGCIKTDMLNVYSEDELNNLAEQIPVGRLGTPEEIAEIILKLAECPSYLTGQIVTADGGWT
jgi:3-oxoacyl-[acyl-carrier protein] reductase